MDCQLTNEISSYISIGIKISQTGISDWKVARQSSTEVASRIFGFVVINIAPQYFAKDIPPME